MPRRRISRVVALSLAAFAASACGAASTAGGPAGKGEELLAREAYGDAEAFYRGALERSPADAKAADGLLKARRGWVDKSLRTVKARRQAGDSEGALVDFERVVKQARDWGLGVPGGVGPLYEEEATAQAAFLDARLRWYVQSSRLLAARNFLSVHKDGFGEGGAGYQRYTDRNAELDGLGARHCESLWQVASVRSPWFADFAARYCAGWGVMKSVPKALVLARNQERFSRIDARSSVSGLTATEAEVLSKALQAAARKSPYFDDDGTAVLGLSARGALVGGEQRTEQPLEHPYALQIPYTTLEEYCEWQQVPVTATKWVSGKQVMVTENRKECVNRTREVAKMRVEPQVLRFAGALVRQTLRVQVEAEATLGGRAFRAQGSGALDESDMTHGENRPDIGLAPDPLVLTPRADWLAARFAALADDLSVRLRDAWAAKYCVPADGGIDVAAEQALRCLAAFPDSPPDFVQAWSKDVFGLDAKDLRASVP